MCVPFIDDNPQSEMSEGSKEKIPPVNCLHLRKLRRSNSSFRARNDFLPFLIISRRETNHK